MYRFRGNLDIIKTRKYISEIRTIYSRLKSNNFDIFFTYKIK